MSIARFRARLNGSLGGSPTAASQPDDERLLRYQAALLEIARHSCQGSFMSRCSDRYARTLWCPSCIAADALNQTTSLPVLVPGPEVAPSGVPSNDALAPEGASQIVPDTTPR